MKSSSADICCLLKTLESKDMVTIINERATLLANPGRFSKKWNQNRQGEFEKALTNFLKFNQMVETTAEPTPIAFLDVLRTAFPVFATKGRYGHYGQHGMEEWYSRIISSLKNSPTITVGRQQISESTSCWDSFITQYLSGQMVSILKCNTESQKEPPMEIVEPFVKLNCHVLSSIDKLHDGLRSGLTTTISKHSMALDEPIFYTKMSRITILPKYLTVCYNSSLT